MLAIAALALALVTGAQSQTPLIDQRWPWPYSGPYQIDTSDGPRGLMQGYNECNSTTQNQNSMCVNAVVNNASNFCIYGLPSLNTVANDEGETVAYCSQSGYGTRMFLPGSITGLQVVKTPGYLAIGGYISSTSIDEENGDSGGELDPHGADGRGNPIGSLMYSTAFSSNGSYEQVIEWHEFIGNGIFCLKVCDPSYTSSQGNLCLNIYDTVGCNGNVPLNYNAINGTFSSCKGDNQEVPNGSQLPIPATSSCTTYASSQLFSQLNTAAQLASLTTSASSAASSAASTSTGSGTGSMTTAAPSSGASMGQSGASTTSAKSAATTSVLQLESSFVASLFVGFVAIVGAGAVLL